MVRRHPRSAMLVLVAILGTACSTSGDEQVMDRAAFHPAGAVAGVPVTTLPPDTESSSPPQPTTSPTSMPPTTTAAPPPATAAVVTVPPSPAPPPPAPIPRSVVEQPWTPFAEVGGVTLVHPSSRVERVGFHQSNHEGARQLQPLPAAVAPVTLEGRERLAGSRTAADVVIDPAVEVRAPVTGTVKRSGTYVLYCEYSDDFVVVEPDARPGWEVKVLHIDGVRVGPGERVVAGETVIAGGPTPLPFESQVDELTSAATAWPHVHIEVVDLAIPNIPSPGGGCD